MLVKLQGKAADMQRLSSLYETPLMLFMRDPWKCKQGLFDDLSLRAWPKTSRDMESMEPGPRKWAAQDSWAVFLTSHAHGYVTWVQYRL